MTHSPLRPPSPHGHHTDRGSHYASDEYQAALKANGIVCSISRRGDCWDNAVAESFFSTLKSDLALDDADLKPELVRAQVKDYFDHFYNRERMHSTLDYFSSIDLRVYESRVSSCFPSLTR